MTTAPTRWETQQVREDSILCAPLVTRDGLVGLLKIAGTLCGTVQTIRRRPGRALSIPGGHRHSQSASYRVASQPRCHSRAKARNGRSCAQRVARREQRARCHAAARAATAGRSPGRKARAAVLSEDLEQLQKSLQVCRRIFGGMLSFSRGAARRTGHAQVRRAIDTASAILKYGLGRSGISLVIDVPDELPSVACSQSDLEQVFLNLLTNAREAMPHGGRITIDARSIGTRRGHCGRRTRDAGFQRNTCRG